MTIPTKLDFIASRKFWCLIGIAVVGIAKSYGILDETIAGALTTILAGYIGINLANNVTQAMKINV